MMRRRINRWAEALPLALLLVGLLTPPGRAQLLEEPVAEQGIAADAFADLPLEIHAADAAPFCAGCGVAHGPMPQGAGHKELFQLRSSATAPRYIGKGKPLEGSSWLNHPLNTSFFIGPLFNDAPIRGSVDQNSSVMAGLRFGIDFDHYWGGEMRFAYSAADLSGVPHADKSNIIFSDIDILYYPWGDSRIRPYALLGAGVANYEFIEHSQMARDSVQFGTPVGGGVKYQVHPRLALRLEMLDNIAWAGDGLDTMHSLSLTFNVEFHFGGTRRVYYPWQPSRHVW